MRTGLGDLSDGSWGRETKDPLSVGNELTKDGLSLKVRKTKQVKTQESLMVCRPIYNFCFGLS